MNFNDHTVTCDTVRYWHYSNERQSYSTLSSAEALIEVYTSANETENHKCRAHTIAISKQIIKFFFIMEVLEGILKVNSGMLVESV
jgi:hypothetical protein